MKSYNYFRIAFCLIFAIGTFCIALAEVEGWWICLIITLLLVPSANDFDNFLNA